MKAKSISIIIITIFTMSLMLCMSVLGIWIYWYLTSSSYFLSIADFIRPDLETQNQGLVFFIVGITALTLIFTCIILIFTRLIRQTEKNKIYNDFINTVSHELKTPLTSIQLSLETLRQRNISDDKREVFYRIIAVDTERLNGLIEKIIETALLDDDKKIFTEEFIIADKAITQISQELISHKIKSAPILNITGEAPCIILFERRYLAIILNNLIENSIKFSTGRAEIRIQYEVKGNNFILYFSDRGIGIPKKDRTKAFEKFSRLSPKGLPEVKGTGLGLYYVRKIIRHFNGTISIIDSKVGSGCNFKIRLPIAGKNDG
jgi:signal transduction histidine kinase